MRKPQTAKATLGEFQFRCPKCKKVHQRSAWSVAHFYESQTFQCDCGKAIELKGKKGGAR